MSTTEISASSVMQLRNKTGLSMMECKKALAEAGGDAEKAENLLRLKLKGKMDTRTDRAAGEGRIAIAVAKDNSAAAIVEIRAETDFTAKNENFQKMAAGVAELVLTGSDGDVTANDAVAKLIDEVRISTGENCSFARGRKIAAKAGASRFGAYVHHDGKTGALVLAEGDVTEEVLRQICMHIVAATPTPKGVRADDVPAEVIEKERSFRIQQAMESGKPKEIAEKIVEGGMRKFFEEITLEEQPFVMDPTRKVKDLLPSGKLVTFARWQVGETA